MIVFIAFIILVGVTIVRDRQPFRLQSQEDWILDSIGLFFQGVIIPVLQITLIYHLYLILFSQQQNQLFLHPLIAFGISFIAVDYFYYWNHRLLHSSKLWKLHQVHHTLTQRHVLGTSRNTIWTSFFILYLWIHSLFIYLLSDPTSYILGVSLTAVLDLWRHSEIEPQSGSFLERCLSPWLILPRNHAWHHSQDSTIGNYGANLNLWDKLHGTYYNSDRPPESLGIKVNLNLFQKLFLPF